MYRMTRSERQKWEQDWLRERMKHEWIDDGAKGVTICKHCGCRWTKARAEGASRKGYRRKRGGYTWSTSIAAPACPKRRKPNRWRLHWRRELMRLQCAKDDPTMTAKRILMMLRDCEEYAKKKIWDLHGRQYVSRDLTDQQYWAYAPVARIHRNLMKRWWTMPSIDVWTALDRVSSERRGARGSSWWTRGRNKIIKRALATGERTWTEGGTTYRLLEDAQVLQRASA